MAVWTTSERKDNSVEGERLKIVHARERSQRSEDVI